MVRQNQLALMAVVFSSAALAQSPPTQDQESASAGTLQEVVVSAQKREESLQDAALSITALQASEIENLGVRNFNDLQTQMPGVQFMGTIITNTTIRGVGTYNNQPNVDAAVAWNVDGTYLAHHMATPPILFDIDRIEVVRGPLGTLYGRNSNGGSINILTAKPILGEWHGKASLGLGNHDQVDGELVLNAPIGETMALRLAIANDYSKGYFEDDSEGTDNYAGRARLLYQPSDRFNLLGTFEWSNVDGSGAGHAYCPPTASHLPRCQGVAWKPYQGYGYPGMFLQNGTAGPIGEYPGYNKRTNWSTYVEGNYDLTWGTLTSISNWHKYNRADLNVRDFSISAPVHQNEFYTQEFRLANAAESSFDWVVGTYYARENSDGLEQTASFVNPGLVFTPLSSYGVENGKVTAFAVFGEVTYPVMERLRLKGGLRYTDEKKALPGMARTALNTANPISVVTGSVLNTGKLTWLVGAEYDLTEDNLLYAKVNTGFKSGNVNPVPPSVGIPTVTTPEEITAYQIGSKNRFLDNRLEVNVEAFFYDYEGYQTVYIATDPTGFFIGQFFPTANAQKAEFKGGEIETHYTPWDSGQFDLAVTLLDAKHVEFVTPTFDFSGHDVQRAPDYTITAGYQHQFALSNGGTLQARVTSMFVDGHYTRDNNDPLDWQESYTNTSANLTYRHPGSRWSVSAWGRNLENEAVMSVSQGGSGRGGWNVFMLPPRMYGMTLKVEM
jgi:iron complex outermembrane recepter protein